MKPHQLDMLRRIAEMQERYGACDKILLDQRVLEGLERGGLVVRDGGRGVVLTVAGRAELTETE